MCNIIKTTSLKYNCTYCINFISYADEYEDDLEPYDLGRCIKGVVEMAESELVCDLWEEKRPNK